MTDDDIRALSDETADSLLNAEARTGGRIGVMNPAARDRVYAEMDRWKLIGPAGCLTRLGAEVAYKIQRAHGWQ